MANRNTPFHSSPQLRPLLVTALTLALSACASQGLLIGKEPSDPPPQIAFLGARDAQGQDYLTWQNVPSFGSVPADLQATGDIACMTFDLTFRAMGYHPKAKDRVGQPLPKGGFYCQPTLQVLGYGDTPPRLVAVNGVVRWDKPGAFASIPAGLMGNAAAKCKEQNAKPLAYHPKALDQNGQPLAGGGYLCFDDQAKSN